MMNVLTLAFVTVWELAVRRRGDGREPQDLAKQIRPAGPPWDPGDLSDWRRRTVVERLIGSPGISAGQMRPAYRIGNPEDLSDPGWANPSRSRMIDTASSSAGPVHSASSPRWPRSAGSGDRPAAGRGPAPLPARPGARPRGARGSTPGGPFRRRPPIVHLIRSIRSVGSCHNPGAWGVNRVWRT